MPAISSRALLAAIALVSCSSAEAAPNDPVVYHSIQSEGRVPCEGLPGCVSLVTRGDPKTGPAETLFVFEAHTPFAKHWHTSPEHVVGIAGTMTWNVEGAGAHAVGAGDYLYYPSHAVHWGECSSDVDCVFFVRDDEAYDIHAVQ